MPQKKMKKKKIELTQIPIVKFGFFHGTRSHSQDITAVSEVESAVRKGYAAQQRLSRAHRFETYAFEGPGSPDTRDTPAMRQYSPIARIVPPSLVSAIDLMDGSLTMTQNTRMAVEQFSRLIIEARQLGRPLRLVLTGWSRGAASILSVIQALAKSYPIDKYPHYQIQAHLFEPCTGPTHPNFNWHIPNNVSQIHVYSGVDENNPLLAAPTIVIDSPDSEPNGRTKVNHYLLPGRHSSMVKQKQIQKADYHSRHVAMDLLGSSLMASGIPFDMTGVYYTAKENIHGKEKKLIRQSAHEKTTFELMQTINGKVLAFNKARNQQRKTSLSKADAFAILATDERNAPMMLDIYKKLEEFSSCVVGMHKKRGAIVNHKGTVIGVVHPYFKCKEHEKLFKMVAPNIYKLCFTKNNIYNQSEIINEIARMKAHHAGELLLSIANYSDSDNLSIKLKSMSDLLLQCGLTKDILTKSKNEEKNKENYKLQLEILNESRNGQESKSTMITSNKRCQHYTKVWSGIRDSNNVNVHAPMTKEDVFYIGVRNLLKDYVEDWFFKNRHHRSEINKILKNTDNIEMYRLLCDYYANEKQKSNFNNNGSLSARCEFIEHCRAKSELALPALNGFKPLCSIPRNEPIRLAQRRRDVATVAVPAKGLFDNIASFFRPAKASNGSSASISRISNHP